MDKVKTSYTVAEQKAVVASVACPTCKAIIGEKCTLIRRSKWHSGKGQIKFIATIPHFARMQAVISENPEQGVRTDGSK